MNDVRGRGALFAVCALLSSAAVLAAEPAPGLGPVPAWVQQIAIPEPDPARRDEPLQFLLLSGQTRFGKSSLDSYFEYAIRPQTIAGLQGAGTIAFPWNASQADLTVHTVEIRRGDQVIDLLKGADFTILRRESNLEQAQLDGIRTVVLPAKGLQLGDVVHVAASFHIRSNGVGTDRDFVGQWKAPTKIGLMKSRVLVEPGVEVKWKAAPLVDKPIVDEGPAGTVYTFERRNAEPFKLPNAMLPADQAADIQFTRFASWSEVASAFEPLFTRARKLEPGSGLAREADRIIAEKADPLDRMMAALQLSQEQVRYVALLLGDGAYVPTPAEENWERKFGDCKGKTALLLALLDRMGIAAVPLLVKSTEGEMLGERLPGIDVFDHVIVKARIGSQLFYLDPTDYGQRSVDEVSGSALGYGLPLVADGSLEKLPPVPIHRPLRESSLTWDATAAANGEAPFTARVILRSTAATAARVQRAVAADKEKLEELLKNQLPGISNEHIEIADWVDADEEGNFVINYKGKAPFSWDEYEGKKGYRYAIDHSGMQWEPKFDRDEGNYRDKDVYLGDPYWQRQEEILLLPSGGKGFSVDASAISETLAGTKYDRSVRIEAGRAISIGEFRHLARSISAEDARGAKDRIAEINEDYAFIVAPRSYRPGKKRD